MMEGDRVLREGVSEQWGDKILNGKKLHNLTASMLQWWRNNSNLFESIRKTHEKHVKTHFF